MATTSIHTIRSTEIKSVEYITNPDKASLITTYGCNSSACDIANAFADLRALANDKGKVLSYHIIQSFAPDEATAEQVHLAGKLLCDKFLQGQYKYVLATHTDTDHIHNHIIICKTNMENLKSFGTLLDTKNHPAWRTIRALNDEVCKELGLSVIKYAEVGRGCSHYEWEQQWKGTSWKTKLKYEIDCIVRRSDTFEDFLEKCKANNIETVYQPDKKVSLKFRMQGQERFTRAKTLGYYYLPETIQRRIRQFSEHRKYIIEPIKIDNKAFQHWADLKNMQNVAQMINLLESYNVHSTSELKPTTMSVMIQRGMLAQTLENLDSRIDSLSQQIELVRTFQRCKPVHDEYKSLSSRKQKKFVNKNAPTLSEYQSAGAMLKSLYPDGKFPSESSLDRQRQALFDECTKLYAEYNSLKKKYADLDKASKIIKEYLESLKDEPEKKIKKGELE